MDFAEERKCSLISISLSRLLEPTSGAAECTVCNVVHGQPGLVGNGAKDKESFGDFSIALPLLQDEYFELRTFIPGNVSMLL